MYNLCCGHCGTWTRAEDIEDKKLEYGKPGEAKVTFTCPACGYKNVNTVHDPVFID